MRETPAEGVATAELADLLDGTESEGDAPQAARRAVGLPPLRHALAVAAPPLAAAAIALLLWEAWVQLRDVKEYLVPAPSAVAAALAEHPGRYVRAGRISLGHSLGGLALGSGAAFALAVVMAHSRLLERAIYPLAILVKVTPVVAVAPLFLIWFGFGAAPKILVAAMITFFPMLVNTVIGLRSVDPAAHDFLRALDASPWQVFWKLRLPSSLPYVMAALRISIPLSLIGAVVAEWMSGDAGVGQLILIFNGELNTPGMFGSIFVLAVIGVTLTAILAYIERRVLFWHESSSGV